MTPAAPALATVGSALGLELPTSPRLARASGTPRFALWMGPDEWLIVDVAATLDAGAGRLRSLCPVWRHRRRRVGASDAARAFGSRRARPARVRHVDRSPSAGLRRRRGGADPTRACRRDHCGESARTRTTSPFGRRSRATSWIGSGGRWRSLTDRVNRKGWKHDQSTGAAGPRFPRVILASVCIPWTERGDVIEDVFRDQIRLHLMAGVKNLYLFGTAGEGYAVTERQFDDLVGIFQSEMGAPDARPMIGLISLSTRTIIERIERCLERGLTHVPVRVAGLGRPQRPGTGDVLRRGARPFPRGAVRALQPATLRARARAAGVQPPGCEAPEPRGRQERHEQHRDAPRPAHPGACRAAVLHGARLPAGLHRR